MSYISETQAKKMLCDAARNIRLCVGITVDGTVLTKDNTFYDLLVALDGIAGGSGTFVTLSGDVVSTSTGGATTIQSGVVTNGKLATVPTLTLKGKNTAGTGAPLDLTVPQVQTMLADTVVVTSSTGTSTGYSTTEYVTAAVTRTLPTATTNDIGKTITYKAIGATVTVAVGANTIDGASSSVTIASGDSMTFAVRVANSVERVYSLTAVSSGGSAPVRLRSNGGDIRYTVVSGSPTVTFTKASGIGTVGVSGGVIDVQRVQVNLATGSDLDGSNDFTLVVPTTQSGTMLQYPIPIAVNTGNGDAPATTSHIYKNPASVPVFTIIAGTAGTSITVKCTGVNGLGSTASIILNF